MNIPTEEYARQRMDQVAAACDQRDGELAAAIIQLIEADGYPEFARRLLDGLIELGIRNALAGGAR